MKRKMMYFAVLICVSAMWISCSKDDSSSKTCTCEAVYTSPGYGELSRATSTVNIDKGSCSDLNATSTATSTGVEVTLTLTCQ